MKTKPVQGAPVSGPLKRIRTPRVAAARRIEPERTTRVWSLLLPPSFPIDRK